MKIAIDVTPLRPDGSGGGAMNLCLNLIDGFVKEPDVRVVLLCSGWNKNYLENRYATRVEYIVMVESPQAPASANQKTEKKEGILQKLRVVLQKFPGLYKFLKRIKGVLNRFFNRKQKDIVLPDNAKADILFCPFSSPNYKQNGIPTVSIIHDIQHEYYPQFFTPEENAHRTAFYNRIVKNVEAVICVSDYTKMTFVEKYPYPNECAYTVHSAIQNRFFGKPNMSILDKLNLNQGSYILYPANFWEHKNHKLLLQAFSMYIHQGNTGKLLLTGNALGKEKKFEALFEGLGIKDHVIIAGYVAEEELYGLYTGAKGVIFPSLFEGFGIPVVEAMHIDKLIACSNLTSLPEIGCDAIHYFNPKRPDEIVEGIRYLFETEMTDEIRESYHKRLQDFSNEKMIRGYMEVFKRVIADKERYVYNDQCEGISPDHWSADQVFIQPAASVGAELKLTLQWPGLPLPDAQIDMRVTGEEPCRIEMKPGQTREFSWKVEYINWECRMDVLTMWKPSEVLQSEDQRSLGICVLNAELIYPDGSVKSLI